MLDSSDEKWTKWIAVTTTVFAVCAAVSSVKGSSFSTKIQLFTTEEANAWSYFQSKSIKEHVLQMQHDSFLLKTLDTQNPKARMYLEKKIKKYEEDLVRYQKEKEQIRQDAEKLDKQQKANKHHSSCFLQAVMFLQLAVVMSSISSFVKKQSLWLTAITVGIVGFAYMILGFFW